MQNLTNCKVVLYEDINSDIHVLEEHLYSNWERADNEFHCLTALVKRERKNKRDLGVKFWVDGELHNSFVSIKKNGVD